MYLLYTTLTALGAVLLLPYFLILRMRRGRYFHGTAERFGFLPPQARSAAAAQDGAIWIHAVSVGEVLAATSLAGRLRDSYPTRRLVISTTTPAGQALARERILARSVADAVFYFPFDWPFPVRRAFRAVRPAIVIIVETEIWPNFLRHARRRGVPVVIVNGRFSARSHAGYQRWHWLIGGFFQRVLGNARLFLMQSQADADRVRSLGADPARVEVTGNLKYEVSPPPPGPLVAWLEQAEESRDPMLVAGSVLAGEEDAVLDAFAAVRAKFPDALLILAPRKTDRFDTAAEIVVRRGLACVRRTAADLSRPLDAGVQVLLLDTVGELAAVYQVASVVFVGGSLVPAGGHNILEPAVFGNVPVFGPYMENFRDMARAFREAGASVEVSSGEDLGRRWIELLEDVPRRESLGAAARRLVERNRGATERTLERLATILEESRPRAERQRPLLRTILRPLSPVYGLVAAARALAYRAGLFHSRRLPATVISVGNLTVGGTGKTPFVAWLAERLVRDGRSVGILTRGYRGFARGSGSTSASGAGATADEPELLRARLPERVPVAVNPDRCSGAQPLLAQGINWFVMDDGFQHLKLYRDVNVALVDATDPFGGGLLPAGRAREPRSALGRADILVITRAVRAPGLEAALRRYSQAPIFYAATAWDDLVPLPGAVPPASDNGQPRYFAFCAIGNPEAFFADLRGWSRQLRGSVVGEMAFRDHHRFTADDLAAIERAARISGASALVCTEKDARNLPAALSTQFPLYFCRIRLAPADEDAVYSAILNIAERRRGALP